MIQVTESTEIAVYRRQTREMNESLLVSAARQHELAELAGSLNSRLQAAVHARDHFLAVLSHELRNPLAALSSGLHLLKTPVKNTSATENTVLMMERQLKQMVRLVDDLLDVSRIATGKLELHKERVQLAAVIRDAEEGSRPAIEGGEHRLIIVSSPDPIVLDADAIRLSQVLLNLLTNAAKFSERGGLIWLTVKREANEVAVSVRDAGIGISPNQLPHIFEVFLQVDRAWQRAQGGLGIGLSLVKQFVELHGGRVEAKSDGLGKGSEFIVYLPLAVDRRHVVEPLKTKSEPSQSPSRRILVVDDNRDASESLAALLELSGHEVRVADGGEAGVAAEAEFRPKIILMDLGMPRVDGFECARRIRAQPWGAEPFIVALTGWGADDDRQRSNEAGFNRHLVKPVAPAVLMKLIAELPNELP